MQRIEVNGLVYEFEDDMSLMSLLDENADRVYEGIATEEAPPNDPLTLEELREMDGEPVWVAFTPDTDGECLAIWALISVDKENNEIFLLNSIGGSSAYEEVCVDIESIYRRKS